MVDQRMIDLKKRFCMSTIVGGIVVLLIAFSTYPFVSVLLLASVAALTAVAIWEYARLAKIKGLHLYTQWMIVTAVAEVIALYVSLLFVEFPQLPIFVLAISLALFFLLHFRSTNNSLYAIAVEFFGVVYIAVPLSLILGVLYPTAHL